MSPISSLLSRKHSTFPRRKIFTHFKKPGSDNFPPHLAIIPPADQVGLLGIFNAMRLADTATLFVRIIPDFILKQIHDDPMDDTISAVEARNRTLRSEGKDIFAQPNNGDRSDWYSDAVFAQQQFRPQSYYHSHGITSLDPAVPTRGRCSEERCNDSMPLVPMVPFTSRTAAISVKLLVQAQVPPCNLTIKHVSDALQSASSDWTPMENSIHWL